MNRAQKNLQELWYRYEKNTHAADALHEVEVSETPASSFDLVDLLRHHEEEEIEDEDELAMRDAFDDLLAFYSCVEVASLICFVPRPLPKKFRISAEKILSHPDIRRYYRRHYPLSLPAMLLERLTSSKNRSEKKAPETIPLFFEFLHISNILEDDRSVEMLLWFLDDGYHGSHDWKSTLAVLANPQKLLRALTRPPRKRNPSETAVDGLRKFLMFCVGFDDLLKRSEPFPLLRSAMWHYHGYWFRILRGKVRKAIEDALANFRKWSRSPAAKQLSKQTAAALNNEATASLRTVSQTVKRLTGTKYGRGIPARREPARSKMQAKTRRRVR
jgi:hypothetical protein